MSTNKFLTFVGSATRLVQAIASSTGVSDANKIIATGSDGLISPTLMPTGIGPSTQTVAASEALSGGDFINIHNNAGTPNVRKADASNGRPAHGFVLSSVANGANALVFRSGANTGLTGLTPGAQMFLSATTAGLATVAPPSAAGQLRQPLGVAVNATTINYEFDEPIFID